ncbi:MAG TPA: hypothetical protein VIL77_11910 [Gaiellaceae bacterium]
MRARLQQSRLGATVLAAWGVLIGVAPHVLHHVGPLAGAALLAGSGGKLLFGALGLVLSIPFLLRLYRRFHSLLAPALATVAFAAVFAFSTLVVSPLITSSGDNSKTPGIEQPSGHASHHLKK